MIRKKYNQLSVKIIILLAFSIFIICIFYAMMFSSYYGKYEDKIVGEESVSTLHSLDASIETIIGTANEYSKILIADDVIQGQMQKGDLFGDISGQSNVIHKIYAMLQFSNGVDAIWLIDGKNQKLTVGSNVNTSVVSEIEKYDKIADQGGQYSILCSRDGDKRHLSLVRTYTSLEDFKNLGLISVDISYEYFDKMISSVIDLEEETLFVLNDKNELLYQGGSLVQRGQIWKDISLFEGEQDDFIERKLINNRMYMITCVKSNVNKWKILRYTPLHKKKDCSDIVKYNVLLILCSGMLILFAAGIVSILLTRPIQKLLSCMAETEEGKFRRTDYEPILDEFKELFHGYNHMVDQIERLLKETVERQRRIRQVELNEIQEQMKPHFLYNTLDSIQALALMGKTDKVCEVVEALGDFYRKSVSGGREFLTLQEEFQMTGDYVNIMKIRFGESFAYETELMESCSQILIPKLTIQPLVENAFGHGIRAKDTYGEIVVSATMEEGRLHIMVADNGAGVPQQVIQELSGTEEPERRKSLGLRGTIERLRLVYEGCFSFEIVHEERTEIHLYIDKEGLKEKDVE